MESITSAKPRKKCYVKKIKSGTKWKKIVFEHLLPSLAFFDGELILQGDCGFDVDANTKFDCSSPQYRILQSQIENSEAWYKFVLVHQPFVTAKSEHDPNGQFDCYHAMFKANGVDMARSPYTSLV
jgi:hypothetical protein